MSLLKKSYGFYEGSQIISYLQKEGGPLKGEAVIPEEDTGIQNYYPGVWRLKTDTEDGQSVAVFEPGKLYADECPVMEIDAQATAIDGLGFVRSRNQLSENK